MPNQHETIVSAINDSFLESDMEKFLSFCSEDLTWTIVGDDVKTGKDEIRKWMGSLEGCEPPKFDVERMISNDDWVVCYGGMTMKGESGLDEPYSFCDIYRFADGNVIDLRSFIVKEKT